MTVAGRKPKPLALHILEGNPSHIDLEKRKKLEPKPARITPKCPEWLNEEAKKEWKRIVPELKRLGLLTIVDYGALVGYCQSWGRYVEAEKKITEQGLVLKTRSGYKQVIPEVTIAQKYLQLCKSFAIEFGLTPSSRGRISLPNEVNEDPLEEMFRRG